MTVSAEVLASSVSPEGHVLTTMKVTCHRFVLAEVNTHRVFSRNWRSSRAVPVRKLLDEARRNPAMPVFWGSNKPGMQAGEELIGMDLWDARERWRRAAISASLQAEELMKIGLHKQIANRVLEPFLYVHGVITSTEWDNFYALRCHPDAQPEMRVLAEAMREAHRQAVLIPLRPGEWHLPLVNVNEELVPLANEIGWDVARKAACLVSAARCARVSYRLHDGTESSFDADQILANKLKASGHWSPFEHQASPDQLILRDHFDEWESEDQHRNFSGWCQHRAFVGG